MSSSQQEIPVLAYERMNIEKEPKADIDKDLALLLNVLFTPKKYIVPVPVFSRPEQNPRINAVFIGGSFCWRILDVFHEAKTFRSLDFYFYYILEHASYPPDDTAVSKKIEKKEIDLAGILNTDIVVLEINEIYPNVRYMREFLKDSIQYLEDN